MYSTLCHIHIYVKTKFSSPKFQISPQKLDAAVDLAFESFTNSCVVPITYLPKQDIYLAELFHGPTGSFKDLALQLLPR